MTTKTRYVLTLEPLPCPVPAHVRLRRVLKALLRAYSFRAVSVAEVPTSKPQPTADGSGGHGDR